MVSQEENERLTRCGQGTPLGRLLREYWQPAALVSEMPAERPVKAVRLLGEDLVLFARPGGGWALVSRFCAHRGVDLAYGRLEQRGLRCLYHGWLYGAGGQCLEQPAEPEHSRFASRVKLAAYPCEERNGIVFAYLGAGQPPPFPDYDCFVAPEPFTFAFKGLWDCNWLQGLEGGIDPSHVSFLHRFLADDPRDTYGQQFREEVDGTQTSLSQLVSGHVRPTIDVERTGNGLRLVTRRDLDDRTTHVRVTNLVLPNFFVVPFGNAKVFAQWHVPVDDHQHHWYMILYDFEQPTDAETLLRQRLEGVTLPDYRPIRNRANDWGFDPAEQATLTFTGMGLDINVHDQWAVESMGPIQDRTAEHLGVADRAIIANRRLLLSAIDTHGGGAPPPGRPADAGEAATMRGPLAVDTVTPAGSWAERWVEREAERRLSSPWAAQALGRS